MKRILALTLSLILLLCCFTGCGAGKYKEDTVMTVNGVEVSWDDYVFWVGYASMYLNYQYSMYGMTVDWTAAQSDGSTNAQWCVDYGRETVVQKAIIDGKCAELGVTLDEDDQKEIDSSIEEYKIQCCGEGATDEQFDSYLKTNQYSSLKVLRGTQETTVLTNKLFAELFGEDGSKVGEDTLIATAAEQGYTKANHILFLFTDEEGAERSDSEKAAGKAKLEGFMAELNAIEDPEERYARFLELKTENCEDTGTEAYQFGANTMVEEFYNKSLELGEYEMDIVETSYGYHLMIGLPLDLDYTVTSSSSSGSALRDIVLNGLFSDKLNAWVDEAEVVMVGEFEDFDFTSLFSESGFVYQSWADRSGSTDSDKSNGNTALYIVSGVAVLAIGVVIYLLVSKAKANKKSAEKPVKKVELEEQPAEENEEQSAEGNNRLEAQSGEYEQKKDD